MQKGLLTHIMQQLSSRWPKWLCSLNSHLFVASVIALVGFCFCAIADVSHVIKYAPNPSYDNIPITPKTWEQVDLIYYSTISGHRYTNSIQLLRPIVWLHKRHMDIIGSKVTLSIPEFGIVNVMTTVKAIKPIRIDTRGIDWSKQNSAPVIGKFMRYVTDVRTYTFKDSLGHISHINATPNHPFYVKNKHGFLAIEDVKDTYVLVGMESTTRSTVNGSRSVPIQGDARPNDVVHLVCGKGIHSHCGKPYSDGKRPVAVYNLEVYRNHVFRVGVQGVVVHNQCGMYLLSPDSKLIFPEFKPKINGIIDDSTKYNFDTSSSLSLEYTQKLNDWMKYNFSRDLGNTSDLASKNNALIRDVLEASYYEDSFYSHVTYNKKLIALSEFRFNNKANRIDIANIISDPHNIISDNRLSGFGARLVYEGIDSLRQTYPTFSFRSKAITLVSGKIHQNLGFARIGDIY